MRITSRFAARAAAFAVALAALSLWAPTAFAAGPLAGAARVGSAPANQQLTVLLPLKVDQAGLAKFATAVSTPGSSQYGHYASMSTLARRFGARPAVRTRVISFLRRSGATRVAADRTGLYVSATAVGRPRAALVRVPACPRSATTAEVRRRPLRRARERHARPRRARRRRNRGRRPRHAAVGADAPPAPTSTARQRRRRVADSLRPPIAARRSRHRVSARAPAPRAGCGAGRPEAEASPRTNISTAYGLSSLQAGGFSGAGERVALLEIDGFKTADIRRFDELLQAADAAPETLPRRDQAAAGSGR